MTRTRLSRLSQKTHFPKISLAVVCETPFTARSTRRGERDIMNGVNGGGGGSPGLWQEARNADGRVYYYNVQTKATQWTKPVEMMSGAEVSSGKFTPFDSLADVSNSVRLRINHGRSIPPRAAANTGTTQRQKSARGRCPKRTNRPWRNHRRRW